MPITTKWPASEALDCLDPAERDLIVDFSAVRRVDPAGLRALDELSAKARARNVRVTLRGVNVEVYKVLKVSATAAGFAFQ